ncbi:MAG: hypothetical protein IKD31_05760 [Clostridia bacterium]|nr:hypothetical protein [Clostridia bacterium]
MDEIFAEMKMNLNAKKAPVPFSQIFDGRYPIFPSRTAMGKSRWGRGTGDRPGWKEPVMIVTDIPEAPLDGNLKKLL